MKKSRTVYKVILIGDAEVGKTSIRQRYIGEGFNQKYMVTLGADFVIKRMGENVVQIWDLAGQPMYKKVRGEYYSGADGAVIVFDISRQETFFNLKSWIEELNYQKEEPIPLVLVGNKVDLRSRLTDTVKESDAIKYSKELSNWTGFNIPYIESSALEGINIHQVFKELTEEIENARMVQFGK